MYGPEISLTLILFIANQLVIKGHHPTALKTETPSSLRNINTPREAPAKECTLPTLWGAGSGVSFCSVCFSRMNVRKNKYKPYKELPRNEHSHVF